LQKKLHCVSHRYFLFRALHLLRIADWHIVSERNDFLSTPDDAADQQTEPGDPA
jgi:hypothetical protein